MKLAIVFLALSSIAFGQAIPDPKEVCSHSTKEYRHTSVKLKLEVYAEYHRAQKVDSGGRLICCEVDHLIPLELGGADTKANLWPQPYEPRPGAHEKDK